MKLGQIFSSVCQEFHSQWGSIWAGTPWQVHPLAGTPPGRYTPQAGPSQAGRPPGQVHHLACTSHWQVHPWQVHPRLAGTSPGQTPSGQTPSGQKQPSMGGVNAGRYGQQAGSMHPTGMHSCCLCVLDFQD